ncbi:MAG: hypothetical protein WD555_05775 [Fulvivirga sp.]
MRNSVKDKIIDLVKQTENVRLLEQVYAILDSELHGAKGQIWDSLSAEEKKETYQSLKESESSENLIDHEQAMKDIRRELGWD